MKNEEPLIDPEIQPMLDELREHGRNLRRQQELNTIVDRLAAAESASRRRRTVCWLWTGSGAVAACLLLLWLLRPAAEPVQPVQPTGISVAQNVSAESNAENRLSNETENRENAVSGPIPRPHAEKQAEQTLANLVKEVPHPAAETSAAETAAMKTLLTETPAETVQPADTAIVPHTEHNREFYTIQTLIRYAEPEKEEEKTEAVRIFRFFRPDRSLYLRELLTINLSINTHEEQ